MKGLIPVLLFLLPTSLLAQSSKPESYNLFHRVPKEQMREDMETDRPDVTESPYTVDAGHIQFESDIFRYKSSQKENTGNQQYLIAPFTFKVGLTQKTDLQVAFESYRLEYHKDDTGTEEHYGNCGSLSLRLKYNIIGNDSGKFALAVMPYVKMPTNSFFDHHKPEGGIIVPAQWKILNKLALGFQEELDMVAEDDDYELQGLQSVTISYDIVDILKGIAETYYVYHFQEHKMENYINIALQVFPTKNLAVDGGVLQGFQSGTEHHFYLGIAWRW